MNDGRTSRSAYRLGMHSGNPALAMGFVRRLAALEPDNHAAQALLRKVEAEAAAGGR